jgi:CBS domain-containing protein
VSDLVRDAMVPSPTTLSTAATAQEAGRCLEDELAGVLTRKTLVREVVAAGRDPREVLVCEIAEPPLFTLDAGLSLDEGFHQLEERDLERVPVVEGTRLVGVLSRAVVQRRLAEDEPPELDPDPGSLVL